MKSLSQHCDRGGSMDLILVLLWLNVVVVASEERLLQLEY